MNKLILATLTLSLAFTSCLSRREQKDTEDRSQAIIDSLQRVVNQSNSESEDLAKYVQQIREGFRQINEAEGIVTKDAEGADQQALVENMEFIQRKLQDNRALIAGLQQQLRNANQTNKDTKSAYEAMVEEFNRQLENKSKEIEELRKKLNEQEQTIAQQGQQIEQLNGNVEDLTSQNAEKDRTVAAQDKQIHTAWYVFGTKKELRDNNILERNGSLRSSNFNRDYFTKIDVRVMQKIPLYSKKVELKTPHPANSYVLEKDAQGSYTLRITDVDKFWSMSRYLVVQVK